jgi:alkylresorcinol/alkylpyrone synthase
MSKIIGVQTHYPEHRYPQSDIMSLIQTMWPEHAGVVERLTSTSGVEHRNLILPLERYKELGGFEKRNAVYIEQMMKVIEKCCLRLQEKLGFDWKDVGIITSTTITGIAVPSIDARLMNLLPLSPHIVRNPLFGIGCLGGMAALNRTKDLLKAYPEKLALVIAAEACSLTSFR